MTWEKKNLVTRKDSQGLYDEYRCSICNLKKRYYTFKIDGECPRCKKKNKKQDIFGFWTSRKDSKCVHCQEFLILCPKEGHPNSKYWSLQRNDGAELFVCPNGCLEIDGIQYKRRK